MNLNPEQREENSAYVQLLILGGYVVLGMVASLLLTFVVMIAFYGSGADPFSLPPGNIQSRLTGIKVIQLLSTLCIFLWPAIALARMEKIKLNRFYGIKAPQAGILLVIFLIMACLMPFMEWIALANQKMVLPEFLKGVQNWMREKEDAMMKLTEVLLTVRNVWDFILNILMIALAPAIAEEFLFRGGVQRSFQKMFGNPHVAIWLSAFIFSAIHMQFFGFFPRLFLGAAFGYMYLFTGSLWYNIFAHFLNNGYALCVAWYLQLHHIPLSEADNSSNFKWYGYLISLILTIFLFLFLKQKTHGKQLD